MANKADIKILVGVVGGSSIRIGSGQLIKETIFQIAKNINDLSSKPAIKFDVDKDYLKKSLESAFKETAVPITADTTKKDTDTAKKKEQQLQIRQGYQRDYIKLLEEQYMLEKQIQYAENAGQTDTLAYTDMKRQLDALNGSISTYKTNITDSFGKGSKATQKANAQLEALNNTAKENAKIKVGDNISKNLTHLASLSDTINGMTSRLSAHSANLSADQGILPQIKENELAKIREAQTELADLQNRISVFYNEVAEDNNKFNPTRIAQFTDELAKAQSKVAGATNISEIANGAVLSEKALERLSHKTNTLTKKIQLYMQNNTQAARLFANEFRAMLAQLAQGVDPSGLEQIQKQFDMINSSARIMGKTGVTVFDSLASKVSKFSQWFSVSQIIMKFVASVKSAVTALKEVDTLLTEISKTSDRTAESLKALGDSAPAAANKFGATIEGYLEGVKEMSRAGFGERQSEELAELSLLAQSAGDMTAELANEYIIATNAAFQLNGSVTALNDVLDGQNKITNRNAVSMENLAEATKLVASQAASSGVAVDEMTASVGTMMAVTQLGGETAARAYKAILMNISQVTGEIDDTGEEITAEDINKYEKACLALGVSLKEVRNGVLSLRNPTQVLKELAEAYTSLDAGDTRRANLISAVGGKHRGNQLNALLENWDMYEKMLSEYANSSNSALIEAQKTADSWQGRLNILSNSWVGFVQNFADTDFIKNCISAVNSLVTTFDVAVEHLSAPVSIGLAIGLGKMVSGKLF